MRRFGVIVALGALLGMFAGVLAASPALAGRGHKWELAQAQPFTVQGSCAFDVGVTFPVNKEYQKVLKAADGAVLTLFTGSFKITYTNLSTGKAITETVSGPGKVTTHADGSITARLTGHTGVFLPPDLAQQFGLPPVSVTAGPFTESVAADGSLTSASLNGGHVLVDVCAALS